MRSFLGKRDRIARAHLGADAAPERHGERIGAGRARDTVHLPRGRHDSGHIEIRGGEQRDAGRPAPRPL
jgi:hypothetical protein